MRSVYLVRHAAAAERESWPHADELRPLTPLGWSQALAIADLLREQVVDRFWSSPSIRCLDTLLPTARERAQAVVPDPRLSEQAAPVSSAQAQEYLQKVLLRGLLRELTAIAVCSHGNFLPPLLEAASPGLGKRCPKGGVWMLHLPDQEARVVEATFLGRLDPTTGAWRER